MELKKINQVSVIAKDIEIGDLIPVGGGYSDHTMFLKIDKIPEELETAFEKLRLNATRYLNEPFIVGLMEQHKISMSRMMFVHLYLFIKVIAKLFPNLGCHDDSRRSFYTEKRTANFSEMFEKHLFQCAEFATMAQLYLQSIGADSEYTGGEYLQAANDDCGEQHSFVIIHENDNDFVFDPANNNDTTIGLLPNISVVELTPEQKVKLQARLLTNKRKVAFFETRDIITNRKYFYGYGDGANVLEGMVFEKEQSIPHVPVKDLSRS